ncbi:hypothetical protein C6960_24945, partial [Escherichia coli]
VLKGALWGFKTPNFSPGEIFPGKILGPFSQRGKTPGVLNPGVLKGALLGVLNPKFSPGENFPRGKILGALFPKGENPGVLNPRGFKRGPFWGF